MLRQILRATGCAAILLLVTFAAYADAWNKKTILKVYETVQVPGAVLEPGTYVLKLIDSLSDRHIVCILNEREDKVYTTILAIPNYRLQPTGDTQFSWWEVPAGNPPALRAWFYPGDNFGQEFLYPKGMTAKFAEAPAPVLTARKELPATPVLAEETEVENEPTVETTEPAPAPPPKEVAVAVAEVPEPATLPVEQPESLPETASPFPALGLGGALALLIGLAARMSAMRS